jgi:hypothetical protein
MRAGLLTWLAFAPIVAHAQDEPERTGVRAPPPGTPEQYRDQRPRPPYARWPADADQVFDDRSDCLAWSRERNTTAQRALIRRFDVVHRRCVFERDGWHYRENHAPLTLDPVLEPLLVVTPLAVALARRTQHDPLVERGRTRWDLHCTGDDCELRYDGFQAPEAPVGRWREFSDVLLYATPVLALSPLLTSSGNAKLTDTIVMAEVLIVNLGITESTKRVAAEPRPYTSTDLSSWEADDLWGIHDDLRGDDAWASNLSGHTSFVASTTFGLATLAGIRTRWRRPAAVAIPFTLAATATALQGTARVLAVKHDPSDVVLGAFTGLAVGVLVPLSHAAIAETVDPERLRKRRERRRRVALAPTIAPDGSVALVGVW